jgi:SpoVK/Ycf46/Vps4 family AAA+-type ATPase
MAHPLKAAVPDDALVTPPPLRHRLELLLQRCRARDQLVAGLGSSITARYHPGVRALFVGPSGTGKTLAAAWLATRLGLPIYRVDLATVTSKYIGETEKNLAQLLARAEQSEIVLLFDEATRCSASATSRANIASRTRRPTMPQRIELRHLHPDQQQPQPFRCRVLAAPR